MGVIILLRLGMIHEQEVSAPIAYFSLTELPSNCTHFQKIEVENHIQFEHEYFTAFDIFKCDYN